MDTTSKSKPLSIRLSPAALAKLDQITERQPWLNRSTAIEMLITTYEETKMDERDTTKVYYCIGQGHFWRWVWSSENGGYYFPAFVPDSEAPEDCEEMYCGCNE